MVASPSPIILHRLELGTLHKIELKDKRYQAITENKVQLIKVQETIKRHYKPEKKYGGIDLACMNEDNNLVIAKVYIDKGYAGETKPRFQKKLEIGIFEIRLEAEEKTFEEKIEINSHGEIIKKNYKFKFSDSNISKEYEQIPKIYKNYGEKLWER